MTREKQIDCNENVIARFRSILDASRKTGINRGNISSVLNGANIVTMLENINGSLI